ncbi:hypothetical protein LGL91_18180 (plasmid) [Yersinia ruckeri]|nr:hypothetical protein LGL91_18180 [Yersinia ruckeri]
MSGGGGLGFGDKSNGRGQATISGASASLTNTGTRGTLIGNAGIGSLTISNGATANLGGWGAKLGGAATGNGTMAVSGAGSSLQIGGGTITIGDAGTGTVNVNAGGMWGSTGRTRLILGNQKDSNGIVMVSGASSSFSFTGTNRRDIGNAGAGSLSIDTGGQSI